MKHISCLLLLSLVIIACKNESNTTTDMDKIVLKDLRPIASDDSTKPFELSDNCPDRWDSTFDAHADSLKDSVILLYDQLAAHINQLSINGKLNEPAAIYIDAFARSKEAFLQSLEADSEVYRYSYGNATGAGAYGGCYYYTVLQNRLAFLKELVGQYYWNYDFESIPLNPAKNKSEKKH